MNQKENNRKEVPMKDREDENFDPTMEEMKNENLQEEDGEEALGETEQLKEELGKEKDKFLRLFAEFENYKRRTGKERVELFKTANQEVLHSLLPVLDDFERALMEISKSEDDELLKGVELIFNKLRETVKNKGLVMMQVNPGDSFDPELHEAITQVPTDDNKMKGKIIDVLQKGYVLGDKIIRYPQVVTGK